MTSQTFNLEAYRTEGRTAHEAGEPKHANPYDYRFEGLAANAWDEGWEEAA